MWFIDCQLNRVLSKPRKYVQTVCFCNYLTTQFSTNFKYETTCYMIMLLGNKFKYNSWLITYYSGLIKINSKTWININDTNAGITLFWVYRNRLDLSVFFLIILSVFCWIWISSSYVKLLIPLKLSSKLLEKRFVLIC